MPYLPFAELYHSFQEFVKTSREPWADFELVDPEDLLSLFPQATDDHHAEQATAFEAIGMTNSASFLAFWQEPALSTPERSIVWLDSEGSPTTVFADSFAELLTLLPYGMAFLYKVINQGEQVRANPRLLGVRYQAITLADAQTAIQANQQVYPGQTHYVEWLRTVAGLEVAPDPMAVMERAYQQHTKLDTWLGW